MRPRDERRVWLLVTFLALTTAAGTVALTLQPQPARPAGVPVPIVLAFLAVVLAELRPVHLRAGRDLHAVTLGEVALVLGLLLVHPLWLLIGTALAVSAAGLWFRQSMLRVVTNALTATVWTSAAGLLFPLLVNQTLPVTPRVWAACLLCAGVTFVGQATTVELLLGIAAGPDRQRPGTDLRELGRCGLVSLAAVGVALLAPVLLVDEPRNLVLWLLPVLLVVRATRDRTRAADRREAARLVTEATRLVHRTAAVDDLVLDGVATLAAQLDAEAAHVLLETPHGRRRHSTGALTDGRLPAEDELLALLASDAPASLLGRRAPPPVAALSAALGARTGLVTPLRDGRTPIGVVVLVGRRLRPFTADHVVLARDLAATVGTALRRAWLERSLAQAQDQTRAAEHRARHDPLTGLPNRLELDRRFGGRPLGPGTVLLFVDLDRFKQVNDVLGHRTGDAVLRATASRLLAVLRPGDLAVRIGGDEFLVVAHGIDELGARRLVQRLRATLAEPHLHEGLVLHVGASIGRADADGDETFAEILGRADAAMYARKRARVSG